MSEALTTISYAHESLKENALSLGNKLGLRLSQHQWPRLHLTNDRLELLIFGFTPLYVDFASLRITQRQKAGKRQGLIRACKPKPGLRIVDATAGWGRDAAVLASFGAQVLMLERSVIMSALLEDGLKRLCESSPLRSLLALMCEDAKTYLLNAAKSDRPDVIYMDPMHPIRHKSALVKKDMQALQQILGPDGDVLDLLNIARTVAKQRVVVKWPQRADVLMKPTTIISGKTVRFDVYESSQILSVD